jgi:uncharacterized cofD-like protein
MIKAEAITTPRKGPKIVVLGGGSAPRPLLEGLKEEYNAGAISSLDFVVAMLDSGGSSGRMRQDFKMQAPGDARQGLIALSNAPERLQKLFDYRFNFKNGDDKPGAPDHYLQGQSYGNLALLAATALAGSLAGGIEWVSEVSDTVGRVIPATHNDRHLVITTRDGQTIHGEHQIDIAKIDSYEGADVWFTSMSHEDALKKGIKVPPQESAEISPEAEAVIKGADLVIGAGGSLITSSSQILALRGATEALQATRFLQFIPLMCGPFHTRGFTAGMFSREYERIAKARVIDDIACNVGAIAQTALARYAGEGEEEVKNVDFDPHYRVHLVDLVSHEVAEPQPGDTLPRVYIRHDPRKSARFIMDKILR